MTALNGRVNRRTLLGGALSVGAVATGLGLAGCGNNGPSTTPTVPQKNTVALPEFVAFNGVTPDLPSKAVGAPAGFTSYPKDLVTTVKDKPLSGASMTLMTNIFNPLPTPKGDNAAWKAVESALGGTFDVTIVPATDYPAKFQTTIASRNLPDAMLLDSTVIDDLPRFMDATCADLTAHLSGAAVKAYPNLAAIPTLAWEQCVVSNKIYGLPIPRGIVGGAGFVNNSMLQEVGAKIPTTPDEYLEVCKAVTDEAKNRYAIVNQKGNTFLTALFMMHGAPYGWRESGGKLTRAFETDEYTATLEFALKLVEAKVIVPGSDGIDGQTRKNYFMQRKGAFVYDGLPGYVGYFTGMQGQDVRPFVPAGPKAVTWADNIVFGVTVFKKADDARIKQLLAAANYFAAPFGSAEYNLLTFGVEGTDYTMTGGKPTKTDQGTRDMTVPWAFFVAPQQAIFDSNADYVTKYHDAINTMVPMAVKNPTSNLISPTAAKDGAKLDKVITDLRNDIIAGRKKMSEWQPAIAKWRTDGGDKIRGEYEQALAAQ